jgi:predicted nuclease of predicted toxin-antitoxin system
MRILLDENVPVDLLPFLRSVGHTAESVNFIGWKGIKNGDLLTRARTDFDLFITRDKDFDVAQRSSRTSRIKRGLIAISLHETH